MAKRLIVIAGPTASGKTALGIDLAQHFDTEIISCDSRQVFREMNIGTAKPSEEELSAVKHHFINSHSIHDSFSAGDFERAGISLLNQLFKTKDTVVMVGGSGLYVRALCHGLDEFPSVPAEYREELNKELAAHGLAPLQNELESKDPIIFNEIDSNNSQRVIRALEVCRGTGKAASSFRKNTSIKRGFTISKIGIDLPREVLYERINTRVDQMMEAGLLEEAKALYPLKELNSLQTVGYQELFDFLDDKHSLITAIELIKRNTRRYAKRQITWFKKEEGLIWLSPSLNDVLNHLSH